MTVFVFNPYYYTLSGYGDGSVVNIAVQTRDGNIQFRFNVVVHGQPRVYLSRFFQLLFENPENTRSIDAVLLVNNVQKETYSLIYGSASPEQIDHFTKPYHVRWFTNLPMSCSIFNGSYFDEINPDSQSHVQPKFTFDPSTEGFFLKWMDNVGNRWSFLFKEGTDSIKTKDGTEFPTGNTFSYGGHIIDEITRSSKTSDREIKCCACNLTKEEREYVKSIVKSNFVYLSYKDSWIPVKVTAGTYSYSIDEPLTDFEISFSIPDAQPQTL